MSNDSKTTDPRIEAGAKAWDKHMGGRYAPDEVEELAEEVAVILAAADAVDPVRIGGVLTIELPPEPAANKLVDHTLPGFDGEGDSPYWGRLVDGSGWKGYKDGYDQYLEWSELVRRWGPLDEATR